MQRIERRHHDVQDLRCASRIAFAAVQARDFLPWLLSSLRAPAGGAQKTAAPQPVRAPAVPVLHGNPNPSQPPSGDPWYRDTPDDRAARSTGDRGSRPWIPNLPDWFQPGNGRRGQIQTARILARLATCGRSRHR